MDWMQLSVSTTTEGSELVSEALIEAGAHGTMIEDRQDLADNQRSPGQWDILDPSLLEKMPEYVRVTGYYPEDLPAEDVIAGVKAALANLRARTVDLDLGRLEIETGQIEEEDWAESWKRDFQPFRIGRHIVIKPSWAEYEPQADDRIIEIDPGMAFGSGTHETTGLCAALLEERLQPGQEMIDLGTGTGILAITAALCGAKRVLAADVDPMAVRIARENVARNALENVIEVRQSDLLSNIDRSADIVVANIIADVIVLLAEPVRSVIREGGLFIASGIARERIAEVLTALGNAGFRSPDVREAGEWAAIAAER